MISQVFSCRPGVFQIGKEGGEEADGGKEGADPVDEGDAGEVGEMAEDGGSDASHAEGEAEKQARDHPHAAGHEFLRVDENGGERGGDDQADDDGEHGGRQQADVGEEQSEGEDSQDGNPDHVLAADAISHGSAGEGSDSGGSEEEKQIELRAADADVEFTDQVKGVVAGDAGEVEIFREDQRDQDGDREGHFAGRQCGT